MKFVVIDKTFKDAEQNPGSLPDDYPMDCLEVESESIADVEQRHPGKKVFSADHYAAYHDGCQVSVGLAKKISELSARASEDAQYSGDLADELGRLKSRGWWSRLRNKDV